MIEGDPSCDQARARVADQHSPIDAERSQELYDVVREVLDRIPALGLVGVTVAPGRHGDGSNPVRQAVEYRFVRSPRVGWPRQEENHWSRLRSLLRERQAQARCKGDGRCSQHSQIVSAEKSPQRSHRMEGGCKTVPKRLAQRWRPTQMSSRYRGPVTARQDLLGRSRRSR